jgi:hypothetical protein
VLTRDASAGIGMDMIWVSVLVRLFGPSTSSTGRVLGGERLLGGGRLTGPFSFAFLGWRG